MYYVCVIFVVYMQVTYFDKYILYFHFDLLLFHFILSLISL